MFRDTWNYLGVTCGKTSMDSTGYLKFPDIMSVINSTAKFLLRKMFSTVLGPQRYTKQNDTHKSYSSNCSRQRSEAICYRGKEKIDFEKIIFPCQVWLLIIIMIINHPNSNSNNHKSWCNIMAKGPILFGYCRSLHPISCNADSCRSRQFQRRVSKKVDRQVHSQ